MQHAGEFVARIGIAEDDLRPAPQLFHAKAAQREVRGARVLREAASPLGGGARLVGAEGEDDEEPLAIERGEERDEHRPAGGVGPLHVLEHEDEESFARRAANDAHDLLLEQRRRERPIVAARPMPARPGMSCGSARHASSGDAPVGVQAREDLGPRRVGRRLVAIEALGGDQRPGAQPDLGLEVAHQRGLADSFLAVDEDEARVGAIGEVEQPDDRAQLLLARDEGAEVELRAGGGRVAVVGDDDPVAPVALGAIEGAVGSCNEGLHRFAFDGGAGQRDGDGNRELLAGRVATGRAQVDAGVAQALGDLERDLRRGAGKEDEELVTAAPSDQVAGAQPALQHLGDRPEQVVALQAAVRGVHAGEVIDVEEEQGDRLVGAAPCGEESRGALPPRGAVGDRGEGVVQDRRIARLDARRHRRRRGDTGDRDPLAHDFLEHLEDGGIELSSHVAPHHVERFIVRKRHLERPARNERVVDVGDGKDARGERNLLAGEAVRISRTVPALVVRLHDRAHFPREIEFAQHLGADHRMTLHQGPLFRRQSSRLVQDRWGDLELADVVQVRADAVPAQRLRLDAHATGDLAGEVGDAIAVPGGGVVLPFDALRHPPDDVDEALVETARATRSIAIDTPHAQLRECAIGAIECLHRLWVPIASREEVGELARRLGDEEDVFAFVGEACRLFEVAFGAREVAELSRDDTGEEERAGDERAIVGAARELECAIGGGAGTLDIGAVERHLGAPELDRRQQPLVAERRGRNRGIGKRLLRCVPPFEVGETSRESSTRAGNPSFVARRAKALAAPSSHSATASPRRPSSTARSARREAACAARRGRSRATARRCASAKSSRAPVASPSSQRMQPRNSSASATTHLHPVLGGKGEDGLDAIECCTAVARGEVRAPRPEQEFGDPPGRRIDGE